MLLQMLGDDDAARQVPILMPTRKRIVFPDHDIPVGPKHKIIPSVYAAFIVKPGDPANPGDPKQVSSSGRLSLIFLILA